jgi:hypothetical protein
VGVREHNGLSKSDKDGGLYLVRESGIVVDWLKPAAGLIP